MPEKTNPHAQRLYDSLVRHVGIQAVEKFERCSLSATASDKKKFEWAEEICSTLEKEFDYNTIKSIRKDCSCGPSKGHMDNMKKLFANSEGLDEFAKGINKKNIGATSWCEGEDLFFSYPTCYCSCVKKIDKPLSKTWCYCTLGYTKKMFDYVFDYDTDVELISSVKTGGSSCIIKISRNR